MQYTENNPFYTLYNTPFATPPFDQIKPEHYEPAFDRAIAELQEEVQEIADNPAAPSFENTVVALERSGQLLERVSSAFFNVLNALSTDEMMEISQRVSPKLSESSNDIYLNEALFGRVQTIYEQKDDLNISVEDKRLLEKTYEAFRKSGATLDEAGKEKYRKLSTELSLLNLQFSQNGLKDKNRFDYLITDEVDLSGLPESVREAAATLAREKGKTGWLFDLSSPSYVPFMRYADNRELREMMYRAYLGIGNKDDEFDNKEVIRRIVNIRLEIARLMGFRNFAEYQLQHTMAKNEENVYKLLSDLLHAYKPVGEADYKEVSEFAGGLSLIMPWDWSYYAEKLKDSKYRVNDEMTRPYFELNHVTQVVFGLATQLYGITFKENKQIPVYHPEVTAYEVYDEDGTFLSVLYTDFHPRSGKQSGAWMSDLKSQYKEADGKDSRPQVIIVMNFSRPTDTKPSLLTYDEVNTFLHEFGHALHGMLAEGTYASLSGTNVSRDFVELPSQIMENWLEEKEFLDSIAVHYETGDKIPAELIDNLLNAANFNTGYLCCRQLSFGLLDMAWHTITEPFTGDVIAFEKQAWASAMLLPEVPGTLMSTNFSHLFAGGYAAGYYGYKWAEVLDADAFAAFKKAGIFNKDVARSFRAHILSKGDAEDPAVLYRRFRGQEPTIDALLERNGIKNKALES
jgi:Zn-dependent oligopeptidases